MSARSSVVNGVLTSPKERRSFKPEVESSILSGRISAVFPCDAAIDRCRAICAPSAPIAFETECRAAPRRSGAVPGRPCHIQVTSGRCRGRRIGSARMADKARQKALADVRRAQAKLARAQGKVEEARKVRRESFERARKAGLIAARDRRGGRPALVPRGGSTHGK